jgi:y4mF family transcriptional regulator
MTNISSFVKYSRKKLKLTQTELAEKAGVGIRFIRELEQGKQTLRLDKVNQVLSLFGFILAPIKEELDPYEIAINFVSGNRSKYFDNPVKLILKNKEIKHGFIIKEIIDPNKNKITAWKFISNNNAIKYRQKSNDKLTEVILHSDIQNIEKE